VFWIALLFTGNATVAACLFIGALSVSGAIFLMLERNNPCDG
jgi:hypothetical protein